MKRKAIGIITFMLAISLFAGCGNKATDDTTVAPTMQEESSTIEEELGSTQSSEASTDTQTQASTTANTNSYKRGTWDNNIYTNETLGFTFELPTNWTSLSLEQLNAISAMNQDGEIKEEDGVVYDLSVVSNNTGDGIQLVVGDLSESGEGAAALTPEVMAQIYKDQLDTDNIDYTYKEPFNMKIAEQDYYVFAVDDPTDNTSQWYMIRNDGKYIITFLGIFDTANEEEFRNHMAGFKAI